MTFLLKKLKTIEAWVGIRMIVSISLQHLLIF